MSLTANSTKNPDQNNVVAPIILSFRFRFFFHHQSINDKSYGNAEAPFHGKSEGGGGAPVLPLHPECFPQTFAMRVHVVPLR